VALPAPRIVRIEETPRISRGLLETTVEKGWVAHALNGDVNKVVLQYARIYTEVVLRLPISASEIQTVRGRGTVLELLAEEPSAIRRKRSRV